MKQFNLDSEHGKNLLFSLLNSAYVFANEHHKKQKKKPQMEEDVHRVWSYVIFSMNNRNIEPRATSNSNKTERRKKIVFIYTLIHSFCWERSSVEIK